MDKIFQDTTKIKKYIQIQNELCDLNSNANPEEIDKIINLIPPEYLNQTDELMVICQMFAYYARCHETSKKGNTFKLFQRILTQIKTHLQGESSFFWFISGGLFYLKLWMYENGLISIEKIIQESQADFTSSVAEYFHPEIIEERPEIFENETKYRLKFSVTKESIEKFKELRKKHINWLLSSGDFNDPSYLEIETNRLRLSIKRDDIESFQKILSNSNMSIDSKISESTLENFYFGPHEVTLIEYVIEYNSINLFKFLIMQNVSLNENLVFSSIQSRNYEIIHIIESKLPKEFEEIALRASIGTWFNEMTEYVLNNYDCEFWQKGEVNDDKRKIILDIILHSFASFNYGFIESTILPFLQKNPKFFTQNINEIVSSSFFDFSCYFTKEFFKIPGIDFNHQYEDDVGLVSFLGRAVRLENINVLKILLKHSEIDINDACLSSFPAFHLACKNNSDMRILEMISNCDGFDINMPELDDGDSAFGLAVSNGNFYALQFIIDRFGQIIDMVDEDISFDIYCCFNSNYLLTLKIMTKYMLNIYEDADGGDLLSTFRDDFAKEPDFNEEYVNRLKEIIHDVLSKS